MGVSLEAFKVNYGDLTEKVRHPDTGIPFERKKKSLKALKASSTKKYFNGSPFALRQSPCCGASFRFFAR